VNKCEMDIVGTIRDRRLAVYAAKKESDYEGRWKAVYSGTLEHIARHSYIAKRALNLYRAGHAFDIAKNGVVEWDG
jgi:hypothetical protein